jgi:hypothetical protein
VRNTEERSWRRGRSGAGMSVGDECDWEDMMV